MSVDVLILGKRKPADFSQEEVTRYVVSDPTGDGYWATITSREVREAMARQERLQNDPRHMALFDALRFGNN